MNKNIFITVIIAVRLCFAVDGQLIKTVSAQWDKEQVQSLEKLLTIAEKQGRAVVCLENKVREGLAKKQSADAILAAVQKRDNILQVILNKDNSLSPVAQARLLFAAEKNASKQAPEAALVLSNKENSVQGKENKLSRMPDETKGLNQEKIDRQLTKQEERGERLERKQQKRGNDK